MQVLVRACCACVSLQWSTTEEKIVVALGKPQPPFKQPTLPALEQLIHSSDEEVLTDACWALSYKDSYLSDGTNDKIQVGVCPRLVELLM
ncbi:hypothetical protein IFM89_017398 [Coptis chinensis]|uniref:Uncharacterized protein n=1 Tax=Coptis chinensis TaxID=261450 RepID=A0A835HQE4_9MAGN|nr:hypothetical protein IFM89_017398 [Coptis chinensis]